MAAIESVRAGAWWKNLGRDRWYALVAAWLGWTLDAFFTIFPLIMGPISRAFTVPLSAAAIVFTLNSDLVVA